MESGSRWEERQELGEADGGETIIRIYFMKKESIFNKRENSCHFLPIVTNTILNIGKAVMSFDELCFKGFYCC